MFAHRDARYGWLNQLDGINSLLDYNLDEGEYELNGIDTSVVIRRLNTAMAQDCRIQTPEQERWLSLVGNPDPPEFALRYHSPSQQTADQADAAFRMTELPGPSHFPSGANEDQYAAIGNAVHSYLASLPSTRSLSNKEKERVAERCLSAFSATGILSPSVLVSTGERFCEWVEQNYPDARWHTEITMTAPRSAGGQWFGTGDLLLQLPDGDIVIVDHKSAPIRREHCLAKAATFASQIRAYCEMVTTAGEKVRSAFIHFPLAGVIAELQPE